MADSHDCRAFAQLEREAVGGTFQNRVYLRNTHGSQTIRATVKIEFRFNGEPREESKTVRLDPGAREQVGNTHVRNQRFYYSVVGCAFV